MWENMARSRGSRDRAVQSDPLRTVERTKAVQSDRGTDGEASCNRRYKIRWRILINRSSKQWEQPPVAVPRLVLYPRVRHPPRAGGPTISCRSRRPAVKVTGPYQPPVCDHHIEQPNLSHLEQVARSAERSQISHCRLSRGRTRGVQSGSYNPLDHWRAVDAGAQESVECTAAARLA